MKVLKKGVMKMASKAADEVMQLKLSGAIPNYEYKHCKVKIEGPIATFMFSNPAARNTYDALMWEGLQNLCHDIRYDDDIRVLVITGDPEGKAFHSGLNVKRRATGLEATLKRLKGS